MHSGVKRKKKVSDETRRDRCMGKAEFGTPKYYAKQMKAKGLQKLKFYCQVCSKQCRDSNGFKAHVMSPSHNKNIAKLGSNTREINSKIHDFTESFEKDFLSLLRSSHGTKKVNANVFYQEYISNDKDHVHLNATHYKSLIGFLFAIEKRHKVEIFDAEGAKVEANSGDYTVQNLLISYKSPESSTKEVKQTSKKSEEQVLMEQIQRKIEQEASKSTTSAQSEQQPQSQDTAAKETGVKVAKAPIKLSLKKISPSLTGNSKAKTKSKVSKSHMGFKTRN